MADTWQDIAKRLRTEAPDRVLMLKGAIVIEALAEEATTATARVAELEGLHKQDRQMWDATRRRAEAAEARVKSDEVALKLAFECMNYLGDILNGMDAATKEDEAKTGPAFEAVRRALTGGSNG